MFSLRSYRSLREEEETVSYGKRGFYSCCDGVTSRSSLVTCSPFSSPSSLAPPPATTIAPPSSSSSPKSSSSSSSSTSSSSSPSSFALQSLRAAWRSLSSLGFSAPRLPHLERAASTPDPPPSSAPYHDYRYTQFPTTSTSAAHSANHAAATANSGSAASSNAASLHHSKRQSKDAHRSPTPSLAHCLRRRRTKSKSDNAIQTVGVRLRSRSDHNLHRVCLVGGSNPLPPPANAVFSNVQLSSGSVDSFGAPPRGALCQRSRSLERSHRTRVHSHSHTHQHTRSLERNHKFRIHLRSPSRDTPPDHPAPPPPGSAFAKREPPLDGSGGSVSICSSSGSSSSTGGSGAATAAAAAAAGGMESGQGGSFINKPPRGWLHPDQQLAEEGICYGVRYIGALEVNTSMKSLNFDTRSLIAKECISKVCEAAGLKTADRKRKVVKSIGRIIGERPLMDHAGSNVTLTITSAALTLTTLEAGQVVASHDMPNISFASGGDPDTLDFIAYVARDNRYGRACFVLECGGGLAQDVITTIGQAFELRFKEYLKRAPSSVHYTNVKASESNSATNMNGDSSGTTWNNKYDREYYNDLPGKVPPDLPPPPVPPFPQYSSSTNKVPSNVSPPSGVLPAVTSASAVDGSSSSSSSSLHSTQQGASTLNNFNIATQQKGNDNLIDLTCDGVSPTMPPMSAGVTGGPRIEPEYVNDAVIKQKQMMTDQKDPFDMQPFSMQLTQLGSGTDTLASGGGGSKPLPLNQRLELQRELWYHGPISRKEAEMLLKQDGDFLVRESQGTIGQYVLTGIQNGIKKHLLLVNPEGVVRTKSRTFDSVSHLINYHRDNELPIVSAESALILRYPVARPH